ncbi:MAG: GGDEF domain-containing protein [Planctomycetota bacterium]|jgi:diguanylate cyclase (GGDEF)-like protein/PAS domain S-box-containing protein|nr:GGDEF domain-containing protein [Planctomycetota bacterium]
MIDINQLMVILNTLPNAIFVKNADLRFLFVNYAYEKMFCVKSQDIVGKTVMDLEYLSVSDREFYHKEDLDMVTHGETSHHIMTYLLSDGRNHTCLYWSGGFIQEDGERGLIGVIVDISEQSKMIAGLQVELQTATSQRKLAEEASSIDSLTGLSNRRAFDLLLKTRISSAILERTGFSCLLVDVDHFKQVNDTFGHQVGDQVLQKVGQTLKLSARDGDAICRYGGEEFVLLLPGRGLDGATMVAERLRQNVSLGIALPDGTNLTVSVGGSEYIVGEEGAETIRRADEALYMAKKTGRNRVCVRQHQGYCHDK